MGNQDQQRHHRQILEQQHAHDLAAVLGVSSNRSVSSLVSTAVDDIASTAERYAAQPARRRQSSMVSSNVTATCRQAKPETMRFIASERPARTPADREHQEDDAELGQMTPGSALHQVERVGADHRADEQVAEHRRQVELAAADHRQHRGAQQEEGKLQRVHRAQSRECGMESGPHGQSAILARIITASIP